jgi:hypothetical protein
MWPASAQPDRMHFLDRLPSQQHKLPLPALIRRDYIVLLLRHAASPL